MEKLKKLIEQVNWKGNVMDYNIFLNIYDFDHIIKRLDLLGKYNENVIYCSPNTYAAIKGVVKKHNAFGIPNYGFFEKKPVGGFEYLVDFAFSRGTYEFHLIVKPMKGALVVPIYPKNEEAMIRNSILIKLEE